MKQPELKRTSLSSDLVNLIKDQIVTGELNPGDRIVETRLARQLGISQTPVREAIHHLSGEGILEILPNKGPIVRPISMRDAFELYSMRAVLEGFAARLATENASTSDVQSLEEFFADMKKRALDPGVPSLLKDSLFIHETIIRLANHSLISTTYNSISFRIALANRILGRVSTKQKEVSQHQELVEMLRRGNASESERIMREHIHRSYLEFIELSELVNPTEGEPDYSGGSWH